MRKCKNCGTPFKECGEVIPCCIPCAGSPRGQEHPEEK